MAWHGMAWRVGGGCAGGGPRARHAGRGGLVACYFTILSYSYVDVVSTFGPYVGSLTN